MGRVLLRLLRSSNRPRGRWERHHAKPQNARSRLRIAVTGRDLRAQGGGITRTQIALTVDEDGWCSIYAIRSPAPNVPLYALGDLPRLYGSAEGKRVDTGCGGSPLEIGHPEVILIGKQGVVHHPEGILAGERVHRFRCLRRHLRVRMDLTEREVAKHVLERVAVAVAQLRHGQLQLPRVGALVVA